MIIISTQKHTESNLYIPTNQLFDVINMSETNYKSIYDLESLMIWDRILSTTHIELIKPESNLRLL